MNRRLRPLGWCVVSVVLFIASIPFARATPAPTTTALTISAGGSAVTTVSWGVVTLTAAVSSNSAKVTAGQVNFCDASVTYCTDIHLLGTAQLTSSGTAVLKFLPPVGSHSYKAVFAGTKTMAASTSTASALTVTGPIPSASTVTSSGSAGNWTLAATVSGSGPAPPTGKVSLLNASANNAVIATGALGNGAAAVEFTATEYFGNLDGSFIVESAVVGDFNGDGFPDIAALVVTTPTPNNLVTVLLGDGAGHFKPAAATSTPATSLAAADFNGDGVLDLAVGDEILIGNGDGTFKQGQSLGVGSTFSSVIAGDFNGDGIPDLAFLSPSASLVFIYLGNGDGSFTASSLAPPSTGSNAFAMIAGDFNGDGITDLAVTSQAANTVEVFVANGDGSFTATTPIPVTGGSPSAVGAITACDFNEDGRLDLAVTSGPGSVTILAGDGHGNFSPYSGVNLVQGATYIGPPSYVGCGEFNGDGKTDLILNFPLWRGSESAVASGDGGGNFGAPVVFTNGIALVTAGGDFNGDGISDIITQAGSFISSTQAATIGFSGVAVTPGSGSQQIVASYEGDSNYLASTSQPITLQAAQGTPSVTVTAPAASITLGWPLTVTVTGAGLVPTGSVIVYDGSALLGTVQLNSAGTATISTNTLVLGANAITASYAGDANYVAAVSAPLMVNVTAAGPTSSTIALKPASANVAAGQTLAVSVAVSGSAGGPAPTGSVSLTTGSYSAWQPLSSGAAAFVVPAGALSSGANTLTASYPGDPAYAASTATSTVTVSPVVVAIPAPSPISAGGSATATATFSSGTTYHGTLNVSCSLTTSPAGAQNLPTCTMAPTSLALSSAASGTSVLTVKTTAATAASLLGTAGVNLWGTGGGATILAFLFACGIPQRRRRWVSMLALFSVFAIGMAIGCGGSGTSGSKGSATPSTTPGNYVFTVTGTDASNASITATATVTVTVQ